MTAEKTTRTANRGVPNPICEMALACRAQGQGERSKKNTPPDNEGRWYGHWQEKIDHMKDGTGRRSKLRENSGKTTFSRKLRVMRNGMEIRRQGKGTIKTEKG